MTAARDLPIGHKVDSSTFTEDFKMTVPLRKGQLSTREIINGLEVIRPLAKDQPVTIDDISGPYSENQNLRQFISDRGL